MQKLIKILKEKNIVKYGNFTLRSGAKSTYYCDVKEAFGYPEVLKLLAKELSLKVPEGATCIACSGYGGISLATLVATNKKLPLVLVRDGIKTHGTKKMIDGYIPNKKDIVCIIDDVYTTGSSINDTKEALKQTKSKIVTPVVVLNRSKDKKVIFLLSDKDL